MEYYNLIFAVFHLWFMTITTPDDDEQRRVFVFWVPIWKNQHTFEFHVVVSKKHNIYNIRYGGGNSATAEEVHQIPASLP